MQKLKSAYEVPAVRPSRHKQAWCCGLQRNYTGLVNWLLGVCEKEGLDFRGMKLNHARKELKELVYPARKRPETRHNCKGAFTMPHSHYYDTAITTVVQLWKGFLTWKDKRARRGKTNGKKRPTVRNAQPELDVTMFSLSIGRPGEMGWITLKTSSPKVRKHIPIRLPNKERYNLNSRRITSVKLCIKDSKLAFKLIQTEEPVYEEAAPPRSDQGALVVRAFDLGERNLACSASITPGSQPAGKRVQGVKIHSGKRLRDIAHREFHLRRKLQKQGKAREIPGRKHREANLRREECRRIVREETRKIEEHLAKGTPVLVAIGSLRAPPPKGKGRLSRRLNEYPRGMLRDMLVHKLRKIGLRYYDKPWKLKRFGYPGAVVLTPENGTSLECHSCGRVGVRHSPGLFECINPECRAFLYDGDVNGALNIGGRAVRLPAIGGSIRVEELGAVP